ncbi:MAG TPA: Rieske 2Fe-2S domain-containing protein [Chloroflexota bacterium]|nr:Rieske 2Fe-2S domain-containing protein [Chloroflexota bacterium]
MLSKEQNELITRTNADTPMGRLMRRYWLPALLSEEIPEPDGPPAQVRILGEELVAFRDSRGRIGLLGEACAHRGTSLFYGRNEECGLRCIYHGWKYDVDGNVVDTPAEPSGEKLEAGGEAASQPRERREFRHKVKQVAYPTHEVAGIVWAYLGPAEKKPVFPDYAFTQVPLEQTYVTKCVLECNYLQGLEGECDSAHLSFLHRQFEAKDLQALYKADGAPEYITEDTDFGVRLVALRHPSPEETYVRVSSFVMPVTCWVPAAHRTEAHIYVPIDDTHSWRYDLGFFSDSLPTPAALHRRHSIGPDYRRYRTMANHYLQDRVVQRTADFTGIEDFLNEDACATETMGPIYDRSREHLGQSDKGVIAVRRRLLDAIRDHEAGLEPPHILRSPADMSHVDTFGAVIPAGRDWRQEFPHLTLASPADRAARERLVVKS